MKQRSGIAVIGSQWGDEGKGKVIDLLASQAKHIARAQGGSNAGHTIMVGADEYKFHLIPSGILYPHTHCYIGGGVVLDPPGLLAEMQMLQKRGISYQKRLFISPYAHIVFPYHKLLDQLAEKKKDAQSVGTTGKGIGPCYSDKINRIGLRLADLLSPSFKDRLAHATALKNEELRNFCHPPLDGDALFREYASYAEQLWPYMAPVEEMLFDAAEKKEKILFEGAQGTFLDITFGTYPFVTSSCTLSGGICSGLGVGPSSIQTVIGVVKAYMTRVGHGPFPTELSPDELSSFPDHTTSREIGTTTGRKRRIGWFDAFLVRHAIRLNGVDSLAIMKLDILDQVEEIRICTGYKHCASFPSTIEGLAKAEPVYESHPGWMQSTRDVSQYAALPPRAKAYVRRLEELLRVPLSIISVGPEREKTIWLDRFFEEDLS